MSCSKVESLSDRISRAKALSGRLRLQRKTKESSTLHRVVFLSLARQQRRRQLFVDGLSRFPELLSRAECFQAVDGKTLDLDKVPSSVVTAEGIRDAKTPRDRVLGYILTRGGIGLACTLHRALELIASDEDEQHIYLLCEDDSMLAPNFPSSFKELLRIVESHDPWWEVFHVGYNLPCTRFKSCGRPACAINGEASCPLGIPTVLFGMYGLALPPRGAKALLRSLFPISVQVDTELSRTYRLLARMTGNLEVRALSTQQADEHETPVRVFAPRAPPEGECYNSMAWPHWTGPLIVAPSSRADCTDIQVLGPENFVQQYG
eukprot:TRINITY_DN7120_c0_g1_i1.p1 TRINITY_DN7120_c0_g1~~TRINITY_DN7120_c0_g1_i1.p1  ORF type:complete len:320 (+),score=38.22 TRINITY_DN7120_c0_g1_i1:138-1097(+)